MTLVRHKGKSGAGVEEGVKGLNRGCLCHFVDGVRERAVERSFFGNKTRNVAEGRDEGVQEKRNSVIAEHPTRIKGNERQKQAWKS